jgi:thiamine biosynthesis lipoprotein
MIQPPPNIVDFVLNRVRESARVESREDFHHLTFRTMNTSGRISFRESSATKAREFEREALEWIATFEASYSRFIPESLVGQINASAGGGWLDFDEQAEDLFSLCDQMHVLTHGVFDAGALPLMRLWDWKANPPRIPDHAAVKAALGISGWARIERRPHGIRLPAASMGIDLGGIGKEYAIDYVMNLAKSKGLKDVLVDIGRDLRVEGHAPGKDAWYIGLEEPDPPDRCWTCVRLTSQAVTTSGDYVRCFTSDGRRYGHIIDPRTGEPVRSGCQAVTVIAATCVLAGILSTAAFILGPVDGLELIKYPSGAHACITTDNARHQTRRFSDYVPN